VLAALCAQGSSAADAVDRGPAYREGIDALRARNYKAAIAALTRASEERAGDAEVWLKLGMACSGALDWNGAIAAYSRVVTIDPANATAYHNLGNVHFRRGELDLAAQNYTRALELRPDYLLAAFHLGWTERQANRSAEATKALQRCLDIPARNDGDRRTHADCLFGLGTLRHRAGDYAQAAALIEQVLSVYPDHVEAHYYLGMAYRQLGRIDEAQRELALHEQLLDAKRRSTAVLESPIGP
jgi:tetratricopeptide (TPR) repeat protein